MANINAGVGRVQLAPITLDMSIQAELFTRNGSRERQGKTAVGSKKTAEDNRLTANAKDSFDVD